MDEQFLEDVNKGLSDSPKHLSSKYFYDKRGDELFVEIMNLPEYYLTRAELKLFREQKSDIVTSFGFSKSEYFELIELGAGDGTKTIELLKELSHQNYKFDYFPVDISQNALDGLEMRLHQELPDLHVNKRQGDYFEILGSLKQSNKPKVVLFLGSTIGNFSDEDANEFMQRLSVNLNEHDCLLLGVDLIKSKDIVLPAYNDSKGITRAFNLNLLERINRELGGNFDLSKFDHVPLYDENEGIAKSFLRSTENQTVRISALHKTVQFEEGELIHTEVSRKYNDEILKQVIDGCRLEIKHKFTDNQHFFADYILKRI